MKNYVPFFVMQKIVVLSLGGGQLYPLKICSRINTWMIIKIIERSEHLVGLMTQQITVVVKGSGIQEEPNIIEQKGKPY